MSGATRLRRTIVVGPFFGTDQRNSNLHEFSRVQLALRESAGIFANIPHRSIHPGMDEPDQKRAMARHLLVHDAVVVMDGIGEGSFEEALVELARRIGMGVTLASEILGSKRSPRRDTDAKDEESSESDAVDEPETSAAARMATRPLTGKRERDMLAWSDGAIEQTREEAKAVPGNAMGSKRKRGSARAGKGRMRAVLVDGMRYGSVKEAAEHIGGSGAGLCLAIRDGRRFKGHQVAYEDGDDA